MTAEQKSDTACLLDMAGDYLRDGYRRDREAPVFSDDPSPQAPTQERGAASVTRAVPEHDTPDAVAAAIGGCTGCGLCKTRTKAVPGEGAGQPLVLVVGEGPGADEDASGRPFVGKAGQLLDKMLASIGLFRDKNCFIANVVKCRPPENRDPQPDEIAACAPFLARQIALLRPLVILCAGRFAAQTLLHTAEGIGRLRGRFGVYSPEYPAITDHVTLGSSGVPIPILPTYHPSALLHDETYKRPAWEDLKTLRAKLIEMDATYARETEGLR
ncbi:uracil-DNA glycosylase [Spirochaetia bacterium]|nr:uracil-DNA glycosylase [Spirochaetia bacterium]GHT73246.1 uracil-DNA glycosylase [Spirochaetia bacterium]